MEIKNAIITNTQITEHQGCLTIWINLDYGDSSGQSFGGYALFQPKYPENCIAGKWIWEIMHVVGVSEWSLLKGKVIRVMVKDTQSAIIAIGHIVNDNWFNPKEL